ncbi:amidohydrolase [Bacillus sp. PK3_68]|uniref:amidohydrolase n=1 Tax=Bacillus sp. PK3_68 TaxID=2027408 RepID=UPI0026B45921
MMIKPDVLLTNANVITLDKEGRRGGSVSVTNGRISGIWPEAEPPKSDVELTRHTQVINLKGGTLLPGFIDTHNHLLMYAQFRQQANCSSPLNKSISDIQGQLLQLAQKTKRNQWVLGYGYDDTLLKEKRHPTREELDAVVPHHPVLIRHISAHFAVVNSAALRLAGIDEQITDPPGGHFGRDGAGKLNGVLYELPAMSLIESKIPVPSVEELVSLLGEASTDYLAQGITTNTDAGVGLNIGIEELEAHIQAVAGGQNPMRMQLMIMHHLLRENNAFGGVSAKELDEDIRLRSKGRARLDSAKLFQDGSIQGLTAALREPYYSNSELYGDLIHEQRDFNLEVLDLHKRGYRVTIHGNGDRAIASNLDAFEFALTNHPRRDHRHRIEHVQTATTADLDRMKKLGVAGSFFINHVYYWGDRHEKMFLGPERAARINPIKDALDRDLLFTLHSDCPVTPISPLFSVWAAVNRLTKEGKVLGADQTCDVENALKSMTMWGAVLNFDEQHSGSIELGKRADFTLLAEDPTKVQPQEIKDIEIMATLIDGGVVYENKMCVL